jgi:hypothetical protein
MRDPCIIAVLASHPTVAIAAAAPIPAVAGEPLPTAITWIPAGRHAICAGSLDGGPWEGTVLCDALAAQAVQASFEEIRRAGRKVYLDRNHEDAEAVAWVRGFSWEESRGIICHVEWTPLGEQLLRDRIFYSFSPAFLIDQESGRPSGLIFGHAAGGLVNAPAFGAAMPNLIAARMGGPLQHPSQKSTTMKELLLKILAALGVQPPAEATDDQLTDLVMQSIKVAGPAKADEVKDLQAKLATLQAAHAAERKRAAQQAVQVAVARGAIKAADTAVISLWEKTIEADPNAVELLAAMPGSTPLSVPLVPDALLATHRRQGADARVINASLSEALKAYEKADAPGRARIYASEISDALRHGAHLGSVLAANSLGSLSGDLIVQRALTLLKLQFPLLNAISTDFTPESVNFGQTVKSRLRSIPSPVAYNTTTGYATQDAGTTDVPVAIDQHQAVQISFNANELASTNRDLFGEQVEGCQYAIGKLLVDAIYALLIEANYAQVSTVTLANFARASVTAMAKELNKLGVPPMGRFLLLNPDYFEKLQSDSTIVNLAAYQRPEIITDYKLPPVAGFNVIEAVNLPITGNLTGFGGTPDSLVVATRVPNDYTLALPGTSGAGNVSVVRNPDTGIAVQLVQFIDHKLGASFWRVALMYGVAKGQVNSGRRLRSAAP